MKVKPGIAEPVLAGGLLFFLLSVAAQAEEDPDIATVGEQQRMPAIVTGDELIRGWRYEATFYAWAKSIKGSSGGRDLDLRFIEDILDMLDMAAMFSLQAEYGRWLLFGAYEYTRIGVDGEDLEVTAEIPVGPGGVTIPATLRGSVHATDPQHMLEIGAGYKVLDGENLDVTLHGGVRYYDYNLELKLKNVSATLPPPIGEVELDRRDANIADDWLQPFLGVRFATHLAENWRLRGRFDYGYGSGGDTNEMWMAEIMVDWRFNDWGALEFGYRYLEQDYDNGSSSDPYYWDMTERGPILGLVAHF
jgi:hypothetical protein